ncbi:MAG: hypothetical protein LUE87_06645, partial [Lachnospiraceae bacterium]|nr:hypothetical protein [Lachnospiraceae bacterium]
IITLKMNHNRIEDLTCENNKIDGYRYRVAAIGAECRGHGIASDNTVTKNIIFRNNQYGVGEDHVRVADYTYDDFSRDGGGNKVDKVFLNRDMRKN